MNTTVTERVNTVRKTILPSRRTHETPRLLQADAYTIGADEFQATKAREKSVYYVTFRRNLIDINKVLYTENDNRIVFVGLQRILERILYKPIDHAATKLFYTGLIHTFCVSNRSPAGETQRRATCTNWL